MNGARIRVERKATRWADAFRAYRVVLDGNVVGRVKQGQAIVLYTAPGRHEMHLAMDWVRSPSVQLELGDGPEALVKCWPNVNPLVMLYWMTFGRKRWIGIEVVRGGAASAS